MGLPTYVMQWLRRWLAGPTPAPQLPPVPEVVALDLMDLALLQAEWDAFFLAPPPGPILRTFRVETPEGSYRVTPRYPPGSWNKELQRLTKAPIGYRLRCGSGLGSKSCSYSEFRAQYPDIDPLAHLRKSLRLHQEAGMRKAAATETIEAAMSNKTFTMGVDPGRLGGDMVALHFTPPIETATQQMKLLNTAVVAATGKIKGFAAAIAANLPHSSVQVRFPRSKKARIQRKWAKDPRNYEQRVVWL
jgi:hypothetical protein